VFFFCFRTVCIRWNNDHNNNKGIARISHFVDRYRICRARETTTNVCDKILILSCQWYDGIHKGTKFAIILSLFNIYRMYHNIIIIIKKNVLLLCMELLVAAVVMVTTIGLRDPLWRDPGLDLVEFLSTGGARDPATGAERSFLPGRRNLGFSKTTTVGRRDTRVYNVDSLGLYRLSCRQKFAHLYVVNVSVCSKPGMLSRPPWWFYISSLCSRGNV
jgi:hypothetical protein